MRRAGQLAGALLLVALLMPSAGWAQNRPPVADAGPGFTMFENELGVLQGSAMDPDGDPITMYKWTIESSPAGSYPHFFSIFQPDSEFSADLAGDYVLSLVAYDGTDWSPKDYVTIHVVPNLPPVVVLTVDLDYGEAPLTVHFDGSQSYDPEGGPISYSWSFDDGTLPSHEVSPTHVYEFPGTYIVWLNVYDELSQSGNVEVLITVEEDINQPPAADAGPDQTIAATGVLTTVTLDGSGSSDPEDEALTYEWSAPDGVVISNPDQSITTASLPVGTYELTLTVRDWPWHEPATDTVSVTVVADNTAPSVESCQASPDKLWPPDHRLVPVTIALKASDDCVAPQDLLVLCRVSSSEADDGTGDGAFVGDVNGADGYAQPVSVDLAYDEGTGCWTGTVWLRAERDGSEAGRTYSITCDVWDSYEGNLSTAACVVVVPHDRRKK